MKHPISAKRVTLRPTQLQDLPFLKALWNDGRVMCRVGFPQGVGYTDRSIREHFNRRSAEPGYHHYIIWDDAEARCGEVCYTAVPGRPRVGLDIKLTPEKQHNGLAAEALRALIDHVFMHESDAQEVWTEPAPDNDSARRLYTRCGLAPKARPADMSQGPSYWALERQRWEKGRHG